MEMPYPRVLAAQDSSDVLLVSWVLCNLAQSAVDSGFLFPHPLLELRCGDVRLTLRHPGVDGQQRARLGVPQ